MLLIWDEILPSHKKGITLPETNSEFSPENGWLEYFLVSFWGAAYFQGAFAVSFREGMCTHQRVLGTWMSQEVSKRLGSVGYKP